MSCLVKILSLLLAAQAAQANQVYTSIESWERVATHFLNVNIVCSHCSDLCQEEQAVTDSTGNGREYELEDDPVHFSCAVGCRTTCLLQIGPENYDFEDSRILCVKGCQDEYKSSPDDENAFVASCIKGCHGKPKPSRMSQREISRAFAQLDFEDSELLLMDPALSHKRSGLPHSSYKTIPNRSALKMYTTIKRNYGGGKSTNLEHLLTFIKDPSTDPTLAGVVAIPFIFLLFATMCYLVYIVTVAKRERKHRHSSHNANKDLQVLSRTLAVLSVPLEPDEKKILSSEYEIDDDFVPPPTPPPKYSDIVQIII